MTERLESMNWLDLLERQNARQRLRMFEKEDVKLAWYQPEVTETSLFEDLRNKVERVKTRMFCMELETGDEKDLDYLERQLDDIANYAAMLADKVRGGIQRL